MTISLKHPFQSLKGDPADTTLVRPSNWNAEHTMTMATAKVLGRSTAGTGVVEELSATTAGLALLAAADAAAQFTLVVTNDSVTYAKIQNVTAPDRLLGRFTAGAGDIEEVTLGAGVSFAAGVLTVAPALPRGHIDGCILSNGTDTVNDINITAGVCRDSTNTVNIDVSANTAGKQLDANWVVASTTNTGMRNSAAGIADGTYHIYAARTAASSAATIYAFAGTDGTDPDSAAAITTMLTALQLESGGASYIYARRLGSIVRVTTILGFIQKGDLFTLKTAVTDVTNATSGTSANTGTLASVPRGLKVLARLAVLAGNTAQAWVSDLDTTDQTPSSTTFAMAGSVSGGVTAAYVEVMTSTSRTIRYRQTTNAAFVASTIGWKDFRGKDA